MSKIEVKKRRLWNNLLEIKSVNVRARFRVDGFPVAGLAGLMSGGTSNGQVDKRMEKNT